MKRHTTHVETDAATCNLVRHIVRDIRTLEHEAANLRESETAGEAEHETAASFRRFVTRILDSASDAVRTQLHNEGTWIAFFIILLRGSLFANIDTLPPRSELFATLRAFHEENAAANAAALNVSQRHAWMHYLPSVGVTLGQPTIGFSIGQLVSNIEQKAMRTAEKAKILRGSNLAFRTDSFALVALMERHAAAVASLPYLKSAESIANAIFEIEKEKWKNGTLSPVAWLDAQAANLRSGEPIRLKLEDIELLEIEARKTAKY